MVEFSSRQETCSREQNNISIPGLRYINISICKKLAKPWHIIALGEITKRCRNHFGKFRL